MMPPLLNGTWEFPLGTACDYTSVGYSVLAMTIAATEDKPWTEWSPDFLGPGAIFNTQGGPCSQYSTVPELLCIDPRKYPGLIPKPSRDMYSKVSHADCLNGWGFGNIVTTPKALATFTQRALSKK